MDWKTIRPWILPTRTAQAPLQLPPGLRHYSRQRDGQFVRYHLRIEHSGQALLIVAASEAARLTRSGAIAAYGVLEGKSDAEITSDLAGSSAAETIIAEVRQMIAELGLPNRRYPIFNLADPLADENPLGLIAPFQADVALADFAQMRGRLQALWNAGIPHVRFVDVDLLGSPTAVAVKDLCDAVQFAEDIGMIAGVRMQASNFVTATENGRSIVDRVAELGIDYVVVPWGVTPSSHAALLGSSDLEAIHQVIQRGNHWEFPVVLEAGLTREAVEDFESELDTVLQWQIAHVELYALVRLDEQATETFRYAGASRTPFDGRNMRQLAGWFEDLADARRAQLIWLPPHASRSGWTADKLEKQLLRGPRAGADISIRVDADGRVFPPRGDHASVGAIHQMPWSEIWNHACFKQFRELVSRNEHCTVCPLLTMCAAHCPADQAGWAIEE